MTALDPVGLVLGAGEVVLGPDGVRYARMALSHAARAMRQDGLSLPAAARHLSDLLEQAEARLPSAVGSAELPSAVGAASSAPVDAMTTTEAAQMLGCSARRVVQMCSGVGLDSAVKVGGAWLVERAEVTALQARRAA